MGSRMSVMSRNGERSSGVMEVKRSLSDDVRKITSGVAKLRIHAKRKEKVQSEKKEKGSQLENAFVGRAAKEGRAKATADNDSKVPNEPSRKPCQKGVPHHIVAATRVVDRKWTLSDLLLSLGEFVQKKCAHLHTVPTPSEVAMWVRCADRALQLNGWTINSFLMESHVVFSYTLLTQAFERFQLRTLADVKELVLMCLYVSYTYNANEISYPLRPFLVKHDRAAFWDKCMMLSLGASGEMLRLNQEQTYYADKLASLKRTTSL